MRPLSGVPKNTRTTGYSLKSNVAYAAALNNAQQQSRQNKPNSSIRMNNIQFLPSNESQQRVYSPNAAAMQANKRDPIIQDLQNIAVPQFYPSTTTNSISISSHRFCAYLLIVHQRGTYVALVQLSADALI